MLVLTAALLLVIHCGGCSYHMGPAASAKNEPDTIVTGSIAPAAPTVDSPSESDLAFARNAASDVLTKGDKNASQPWANPETGARGSVTPLASAYSSDGRTCHDFLASFVKGETESWLEGEACQGSEGRWEIRTMRPWTRS